MKRSFFSLMVLAFLIVILGNWSWAACPEDTSDHGQCDSVNVEKWWVDTLFTGVGPYFARVPIYITHDVAELATDSIAGIQFPLCYTNSNPANYCSLSVYWNSSALVANSSRNIFRHLIVGTDTTYNWMLRQKQLGEALPEPENWVWSQIILTLDGTSHFWLLLAPTTQPLFGQESRALMATMTFKMQDTMHVCIDTCFWPPTNRLSFSRPNGQTWIPRDNMPYCFWVGSPQIRVTAPNGGEHWAVGSNQNITWLSENYSGASVKIDYSTNSGSSWLPVIGSTSNNGSYLWTNIPSTPSALCRVKVSDPGGTPNDISDADFTIEAPPQPDFTIHAEPETLTVQAGQSDNYNVILTSVNGFSSPCTLTVSGPPAGALASFNPNPAIPTDTSVMNVSTNAGTTPPGTYQLIITAKQLSKVLIQHSDTVFLTVTPAPNFTVEVKPDTQSVQAGNSVDYNVILTALYGFASPCTLSISALPTGVTASFNPNPATPTDTSNLHITTSTSTPPSTYTLTVTATEKSKGIVHTDQFVLIVTPLPDFTIKASPETLSVLQGDQRSYQVILTSLYGFNSPCTLTVSDLPPGVSGAFDPPKLVPTDTSTLTITVPDTTQLGTYRLIISAPILPPGKTSILHSDTVYLVVRGPGDFTLDVLPDTLHIPLGTDSNYTVILTSIGGFDSPCTLKVAGMPVGVDASFESPILIPTDTTALNISVSCTSGTTSTTPYSLTVTATEMTGGKAIEYSKEVKLWVEPATHMLYMDADPDSQKVVVGDSTTYQVILFHNKCFALPCTLSIVNGLPSGVTAHFSPNPIPAHNTSSILTISTSGSTPAGIHELKIKAKASPVSADTATVFLVVQDFDISAKPDTVYVTQGQPAGYMVKLTSLFGFDDACTLTVSGLPDPPDSGVFDRNKLTPTDSTTLTIYTTTETDTGWYTLTITAQRILAKFNGLEHSIQVNLKVNEVSDVGEWADNPNAPKTFALFQNQPNPFNPETKMSYYLPRACQIKLTIYNVLGQKVRTLFDGHQEAGMQNLTWNGRDDDGNQLSSGIYFYRLQADDFIQTRKMSLVK
jgi:hypothetical protein